MVLQVAATLVLLVAAGLMLRTLANLHAIELGFNPDHLLTMQVALPQPKYADAAKRVAFFDRVVAGVRAQPGVRGRRVWLDAAVPEHRQHAVVHDRGAARASQEIRDALYRVGTADYMQTLGVSPRGPADRRTRYGAAAPSRSRRQRDAGATFLAESVRSGRRIRFDPEEPWFTIVGVVKDVLERGYEQDDKPASMSGRAQVGRAAREPRCARDRRSARLRAGRAAGHPAGRSRSAGAPVRSMTDIVNLTVATDNSTRRCSSRLAGWHCSSRPSACTACSHSRCRRAAARSDRGSPWARRGGAW